MKKSTFQKLQKLVTEVENLDYRNCPLALFDFNSVLAGYTFAQFTLLKAGNVEYCVTIEADKVFLSADSEKFCAITGDLESQWLKYAKDRFEEEYEDRIAEEEDSENYWNWVDYDTSASASRARHFSI